MLCILGNLATRQCDFAGARSYCRESLDIAREREDLQCVAKVLNVLGLAAAEEADYSAARRYYSDSLTIRRELGDLLGVSASLANLAVIARYEKDFTAAKTYLEECLAIGTEIGFPHVVSRVHDNLGRIAVEQGDYSEARRNLEGSIRIYAEVGDQLGICESLDAFAWLAFKLGRNEQSIQLWGAAEALREKIGSPMSPVDQDQHKQAVEESRRLLSSDVFSESWMKGLSMTLKEALELAVGDSTLRPTPV
jgi:tetratricopeptide (TPR) repeat protein